MGESSMVSRTLGFAQAGDIYADSDPGMATAYCAQLERGPTSDAVLTSIALAWAPRDAKVAAPEPAKQEPAPKKPGEKKVLIFSFRAHDETTAEHFQNQITAWYSGARYIHCEVYDPHQKKAFYITTTSGGLRFQERGFLPKRWHFLYAEVNEEQYQRFLVYVKESMRYPKEFDTWNIWGMPLAGIMDPTTPGCTTCARETANLIGYVWGIRLEKLDYLYTPDDVAEWLLRLCDAGVSGIRSINVTSNPNPVMPKRK